MYHRNRYCTLSVISAVGLYQAGIATTIVANIGAYLGGYTGALIGASMMQAMSIFSIPGNIEKCIGESIGGDIDIGSGG